MISRNYRNVVQLVFSTKLPFLARRILCSLTRPSAPEDSPQHVLEIVSGRVKTSDFPRPYCRIDSSWRVNDSFFYEKCQYKFSQWEYVLTKVAPKHWRLQICGDVYSSLVWPYRTVGGLLRVLLCQYGLMSFHSAGFYDGRGAALVLAPSGTGKTLTTLHFLCRGGQVYNDDTVVWQDGKILPTPWGMHFWEHRY